MRYHRPSSVADALAVLGAGQGKPLVGGTDLIVGLRHGAIAVEDVVDLKDIADLPEPLSYGPDGVRIGATATMTLVAGEARLRKLYPALIEGAEWVGSTQIRNRASLVGNICNASPVADTAPGLLVHDAVVRIASNDGARDVPIADFFVGLRQTACRATELVTSVWLPAPAPGSSSAFLRLTRRHGVDLASVSAAARVAADGAVAVALGAVGPRPLLFAASVDPEDEDSVASVVREALATATPISDVRASQKYRHAMVAELTRRTIATAAARARGEELTWM